MPIVGIVTWWLEIGLLALEAAPCVANAELSDADMAYVHIAGFVDSVRLALTSDA